MWIDAIDKEYLLKLTLAVYRVIKLFPIEEKLGSQIRETADKILTDLIYNNSENGSRNIKMIKSYFDLAEAQNWVDARNFLVLRREYSAVKTWLDSKAPRLKERQKPRLGERQEKILNYLKNNGQTPIRSFLQLFPTTNRRTLIRDLEKLCQIRQVERRGNGRGIYYTML